MAKGYYQNLYDDLFKSNKGLAPSTKVSRHSTLDKQIKNKKARIDAAGLDSSTDKRNGLEKLLGLPEDQNFVFDTFELLGRPQQAIFGAINAAQKGEDAGKAALSNLKGKTDTNFKDILTEAGMSDRKGKLDVADVLGFAGDVFLDPADIIPVAGISKFNDALKAGENVKEASKLLKSSSDVLFEGAGKAIKGGAKLADSGIEKGLMHLDKTKGVKNYDGAITKLIYDNPAAKSAANLGKKELKADGKLEKVYSEGVKGRFENYKDIKDTISRAFNNRRALPNHIREDMIKNNAQKYKTAIELQPIYSKMDNSYKEYATNLSNLEGKKIKNIDNFIKETDKNVSFYKEYKNLNRETTVADMLKDAKKGILTADLAGEEGIDRLRKLGDDVTKADRGLKLTVDVADDGKVKLSKDWDFLLNKTPKNRAKIVKDFGEDFAKEIDSLALDGEKLSEKIKKGTNYTKEDVQLFTKLDTDYKKGVEDLKNGITNTKEAQFAKLYDTIDPIFDEANRVIDKNFGTNLAKTYANNKGYVRHAYDTDYYNKIKDGGFLSDFGDLVAKGDTKALQDRIYKMSAREANNLIKGKISKNYDTLKGSKKKLVDDMLSKDGIFKEGMLASFSDYMENVPRLAKESKNIDTLLVKSTFGDLKELKNLESNIAKATKDKDFKLVKELKDERIRKLNDSAIKILSKDDSLVPRGFTQINKQERDRLINKLKTLGNQLGIKEMNTIANFVKNKGSKMAISNDILRLIEVNTDTKTAKGLARLYDKYLNFFKKNKVLSPTFQMNNIIGNMTNMYLAGIDPTAQAKLYPEAFNVMTKGNKVMTKALQEGVESLTDNEKLVYEVWNKFTNSGFGDANRLASLDLQDLPESLAKYFDGTASFKDMSTKEKIVDFLPYINSKMNNQMDIMSRLVTFMYGEQNPNFLKRLGVDDAASAVRKVNFEPTDLTEFERNVMKKIIPFYTFTKKNLAFQLDNLSKNGSQYHKLMKGYDNLLESATGGNEDNVQDWLKNNLYIPIPILGKDGEYKVVRASLPFGFAIEAMTDPAQTLLNTIASPIKMAVELPSNFNTFTGRPIEDFEGQKSNNLPFLTKKQEFLLGNLSGLDVPAKVAYRAYDGIADTMKNGGTLGEGLLKGIGDMTTMTNNIDNDKLSKLYDELDELETLMQQYKQQGYEFSTINELKKSNANNTSEKIMSTLNKLNGIKENPYNFIK